MLPVLLKHFPHRTLVQPRWRTGRRKKMRPVLLGIEAHRFAQSAARWAQSAGTRGEMAGYGCASNPPHALWREANVSYQPFKSLPTPPTQISYPF
jgi:hypothetical protein